MREDSCTDKLFDSFIGNDSKTRTLFVTIFGVSLVIAVVSLSLAIWLGVTSRSCIAPTTPVTPAPVFAVDKVVMDGFEFGTSSGHIRVSTNSAREVTGLFHEIQANTKQLVNCSQSSAKICLESPSGFVLKIEQYDLESVNCKKVTQSYPVYDEENSITTCIDYGSHHWYGGAEVHDHHWPIEKWSIDLQEFVTRDPYFPGYYGSVQERYWLSSAGVGIHLPFHIPLFVSMNSSNDQQLCFTSKFKVTITDLVKLPPLLKTKDSVYNNIRQEGVKLEFDICTHANLTRLHMSMADAFWDKPTGKPSLDAMLKPIWSTWAEYKKDIDQSKLIAYAQRIAAENLPISQLEIDDDWTPYYGDWAFNSAKFPDPKSTIQSLKSTVGAVTIWIHPFINTDSDAFLETADQAMLMSNDKKVPGLLKWWNPGYAGLLDYSNNDTVVWFLEKLENLKQNFSVDSFKFDAGEIVWMPNHTMMSVPYFHPSEYIKYYVDMAVKSDDSLRRQEVRVGCLTQSAPILVRMLDRRSRWGIDNGLRTLIPTALTFGLLGYPFVLPDMIGGNEYENVKIDAELYIRWLQVNVFLPAVQFSIPPWRFNDPNITELVRSLLSTRESYRTTFEKLADEAVQNGWPIVRPLWWIDSSDDENSPSYWIDDEYLLGSDVLVAPVVEQGATKRDIYLPTGKWRDMGEDKIVAGGKWIRDYSAPLSKLPYFERQGV